METRAGSIRERLACLAKPARGARSMHFVHSCKIIDRQLVDDVHAVNVVEKGREVRYNERFLAEGTNVNFAAEEGEGIAVVTYERGVEDETLSCGTGVTASALAAFIKKGLNSEAQARMPVRAKGGMLEVRFRKTPAGFSDIWLCGPTQLVFEGRLKS